MPIETEADTCRKYVLPKLYAAGWTDEQISEQRTFTDGRIVVVGDRVIRRAQKRADYLLRYSRDFALAVVEAKATYKKAGDGLQQAKEYAEMLGLKFAYASNGHQIVEHDFLTGKDKDLDTFPSPDELWGRLRQHEGISDDAVPRLLTPYYHLSGKSPRYYQAIAINRAVQAILQGRRRTLLTLATGTGKTVIAFQICWKLWNSCWNRTGDYRRPRILYLADRNVLVDDPKDKIFVPFGDARHKIEGDAVKSREMYFATYQAIARDERRPGLYREYSRDFFDLVIVDECHRGSASEESNWREILEYYEPAFQLGMTATPLRVDNRDTYRYFGNPLYIYSLKQGIDDGFLTPYRVHRIVTTADAAGSYDFEIGGTDTQPVSDQTAVDYFYQNTLGMPWFWGYILAGESSGYQYCTGQSYCTTQGLGYGPLVRGNQDGIGISQVDGVANPSDVNTYMYWNFEANMEAGQAVLNTKKSESESNWVTEYETDSDYTAVTGDQSYTNCSFQTSIEPLGDYSWGDADWIQDYTTHSGEPLQSAPLYYLWWNASADNWAFRWQNSSLARYNYVPDVCNSASSY